MSRSPWKALLAAAFIVTVSPSIHAASPAVQQRMEMLRPAIPSVIEFRKGEAHTFIPTLEKALADWERWLSTARLSSEDRAEANEMTVEVLYTLAHAHIDAGNLSAAEPLAKRAVTLSAVLTHADGVRKRGYALAIWAQAQRRLGDLVGARKSLEDAAPLWNESHTSYWDSSMMLFEVAQMRRIFGDFAGARTLLSKLELATIKDSVWVERAALDLAAGDYHGIEARLKPALDGMRNRDVTEPNLVAAFAVLADYHLALGAPERAEEPAKELLERREKMPLPVQLDIADAFIRLGHVYLALGDVGRATPLIERAATVLDKVTSGGHPARISLLSAQAEIAARKGDLTAAEKSYTLASAISEKALGADNYETGRLLARLGNIHEKRVDKDGAYTAFSRASEILEKALGLLHPETSAALNGLARSHVARGNPALALPVLKKAMDNRDRHAARIFGFVSEMQKTRTMEQLRPETELAMHLARLLPDNEDAQRLALTAVLRRKGRVLDGMAMSRAALRDANSPDEKILMDQIISLQKQIVALIIRGPQGRSIDDHRAAIRELDAQKQKLEAQESRMSQRRLLQENPITIEEVAAALPKGSALVEYAQTAPPDQPDSLRYTAWVLFPDASMRTVDLGFAAPIHTLVETTRRALANSKSDPKALARKLDEAIMRPIRDVLGKTRWLFVSPDGDLNLVPFGALRDDFNHYLLDTYSFTYLTSGRDLLLGEAIDAPEEGGAEAVLFGNPEFGEKKLGRRRFTQRENEAPARGARALDLTRVKFTPLEGTAGEIAAIKKTIPSAQVFLGAESTEAQVKAVKHPRILHLATHGFFLPDKPSLTNPDEDAAAFRTDNPLVRAGLALAGANNLRSGEEDGVLTAFEAAGLDLYGTKLVVLSACETGVGEARSGEGVYGMRRALAMAGAETTVMSLWQVDDAGTRDLMVGYYDRLLNGGGRSESMRQAALALKAQPKYEHPYYWASFIVSGDGTALSGKQIPPAPSPVNPGPRGCACEIPADPNSDSPAPHLFVVLGAIAGMRLSRRRNMQLAAV